MKFNPFTRTLTLVGSNTRFYKLIIFMGGVTSGSDDALIDLFRADAIFRMSRTRLVPKNSSDCSYRGPYQ